MHRGRLATIGILVAIAFVAATVAVRRLQRSAVIDQCLDSARHLGMATFNFLETGKCLPSLLPKIPGTLPPRWRTVLFNSIDAGRVLTLEELKARPASVFHLADPSARQTNIYAITGEGATYSPELECKFDGLPPYTLLYASGRPSDEPWYEAGDIPLRMLQQSSGSVREVLGEACEGLTFLVFVNGEAIAVDSSMPVGLLAKQADTRDPASAMIPPEFATHIRFRR